MNENQVAWNQNFTNIVHLYSYCNVQSKKSLYETIKERVLQR